MNVGYFSYIPTSKSGCFLFTICYWCYKYDILWYLSNKKDTRTTKLFVLCSRKSQDKDTPSPWRSGSPPESGKKKLRNLRADPVPKEAAYQLPKPSMYDRELRGPNFVTEQAMAHYLLQNMRQIQPMLPPPKVCFQDLTKQDNPSLSKQ